MGRRPDWWHRPLTTISSSHTYTCLIGGLCCFDTLDKGLYDARKRLEIAPLCFEYLQDLEGSPEVAKQSGIAGHQSRGMVDSHPGSLFDPYTIMRLLKNSMST